MKTQCKPGASSSTTGSAFGLPFRFYSGIDDSIPSTKIKELNEYSLEVGAGDRNESLRAAAPPNNLAFTQRRASRLLTSCDLPQIEESFLYGGEGGGKPTSSHTRSCKSSRYIWRKEP